MIPHNTNTYFTQKGKSPYGTMGTEYEGDDVILVADPFVITRTATAQSGLSTTLHSSTSSEMPLTTHETSASRQYVRSSNIHRVARNGNPVFSENYLKIFKINERIWPDVSYSM